MNSKNTRDIETTRRHLSTTQKFADERIQELSCEALFRCQDIDSTQIEVIVTNGIVHLAGAVQDKASVRVAETLIQNIPEISGIENELVIRKLDPSTLN